MNRNNHKCARKNLILLSAMLIELGSMTAFAAPTTLTTGTSFDMWDSTGTRTGTRDNTVTGNFDIIAESASLTSTRPFFGLLWTAYNTNLYGPGTYTVSTLDTTGPAGTTPVSGVGPNTTITFTVPAGHVGAHMKFAWGSTSGIDVVNLWNTAGTSLNVATATVGVYDPNSETITPIPGLPMVDGPFAGFSANFNLNPSPTANTAPAVSSLTISTDPGVPVSWTPTFTDNVDAINDTTTATCSVASQPAGGVGVATISNCSTASFNPQGLAEGSTVTFTYQVNDRHYFNNIGTGTVTVTIESHNPPTASDAAMTVNGSAPGTLDLSSSVMDGDGNQDMTTLAIETNGSHGVVVSNGDGTVTYTASTGFSGYDSFAYTVSDAMAQVSNAATVAVTVNATQPSSGSRVLVPGALAASVGSSTGGGLTITDVGADDTVDVQCIGGCFDFEVSGLGEGYYIDVVLPLSEPISSVGDTFSEVKYRGLNNSSWQDYLDQGGDFVSSAPAISTTPLVCPPAGSAVYAAGLGRGHQCVQLFIADGGVNDADGVANGAVRGTGGIAGTYAGVMDAAAGGDGVFGVYPGFVSAGLGLGIGLSLADLDGAGIPHDLLVDQQCIGGCFNFEVDISGNHGGPAQVVLPLSAPIPPSAGFRVYSMTTFEWVDFVSGGSDVLASSARTSSGGCPLPGDSHYVVGLVPGNTCVQMTIRDDGSNDADQANGVIQLLGGVALIPPDTDHDGVLDKNDNCRLVANSNQRDTNGDGFGNICDPDLNNDGVINFTDLGIMRSVFFTSNQNADLNGDGVVNIIDLAILKKMFFMAPGPRGIL